LCVVLLMTFVLQVRTCWGCAFSGSRAPARLAVLLVPLCLKVPGDMCVLCGCQLVQYAGEARVRMCNCFCVCTASRTLCSHEHAMIGSLLCGVHAGPVQARSTPSSSALAGHSGGWSRRRSPPCREQKVHCAFGSACSPSSCLQGVRSAGGAPRPRPCAPSAPSLPSGGVPVH
jgi:hypothetical protein